jgi:hypothetical protein
MQALIHSFFLLRRYRSPLEKSMTGARCRLIVKLL